VHGGDLYDPSKFTSPHRHPILRLWVRHLLRRADKVVGQSNNTLDNTRRYYCPQLEASRISLGIQRPPIVSGSRDAYGFGEDEVLLVTVGRLIARKATSQLIAMMDRLRDENVRLLILGSGPEEQALKGEVARRKLGDKVCFMGFVEEEEKFRLLQMSDVYVSTSQHEGFGLVFLEGMASRLPVICYDFGGQTDFLEDGKTGYLVPLNDLETFIERCRHLVKDGKLRRAIGWNNVQRVNEFFLETCAQRYEELFQAVLGASSRRTLSKDP
jgi:glycosyltransferase involved in cell wall biosynthesis